MALRYVGRVQRARGLKGAFLLDDLIENFHSLRSGSTVRIGYSAEFGDSYTVAACSRSGKRAVLTVQGIDSPEAVNQFREKGVFADDDAFERPEKDGGVFDDEIVGCEVFDIETGKSLGTIHEVWHMPANNVWAVDMGGRELPLPVIDDVIKKVDIAARRVDVYLIPGLIDLAE